MYWLGLAFWGVRFDCFFFFGFTVPLRSVLPSAWQKDLVQESAGPLALESGRGLSGKIRWSKNFRAFDTSKLPFSFALSFCFFGRSLFSGGGSSRFETTQAGLGLRSLSCPVLAHRPVPSSARDVRGRKMAALSQTGFVGAMKRFPIFHPWWCALLHAHTFSRRHSPCFSHFINIVCCCYYCARCGSSVAESEKVRADLESSVFCCCCCCCCCCRISCYSPVGMVAAAVQILATAHLLSARNWTATLAVSFWFRVSSLRTLPNCKPCSGQSFAPFTELSRLSWGYRYLYLGKSNLNPRPLLLAHCTLLLAPIGTVAQF